MLDLAGSRLAAILAVALSAAIPAAAGAHGTGPTTDDVEPLPGGERSTLATIAACSGEPITPDRVISGSFGPALEGSYVMVPFDVPAGTDAVRVKYCFDQPRFSQQNSHTIDMGIYEARPDPGSLWGEAEFRGWGGSSRRDVTISPEGSIDPDPPPVATEETTIGYRPGPTPAGEWAVELGVAAIGSEGGDEDGVVNWRVEIDVIDDPAFADEPYAPVPYDPAPAAGGPGWYAGDLHVHARHSAPGDATMRETFNYAFCPDPAFAALCADPLAQPGAGLDFITLSDYVGDRAWDEIGAFQADYPGKLIVRGAEVITYRGHTNNQASAEFVDYRTGPIHEAEVSGPALDSGIGAIDPGSPDRAARPAREILSDVLAAGGWTQLNHVETFPSEIPTFGNLCRGCSWEYDEDETDYGLVDAIEVATGPGGLQTDPNPGPNPFTPLALLFYEDAIDAGGLNANRIAMVAASDSHNAGDPNDAVTQSPIGQGMTVVRAPDLSEAGIRAGIKARRTYVKIWGADGPDLRLTAHDPDGGTKLGMIGDDVAAGGLDFEAEVLGLNTAQAARPGLYALSVLRNGDPFITVPIPPGLDEFSFGFPSPGTARYRLQVDRTASGVASIEAASSPIWHVRSNGGGGNGGGGNGGGGNGGGGEPGPCEVAIDGTDGDDRLVGTERADLLRGLGGDDHVLGVRGEDCLRGNRGEDRVEGGPGGDEIRGAAGADEIRGGSGPDLIRGGRDADVVAGGRGADEIRGQQGRDKLRGRRGNDTLRGGAGRDLLTGARGADLLRAGSGRDTARGGRGADHLETNDRHRDVVRCGRGRDTAVVDRRDRVFGCERVRVVD